MGTLKQGQSYEIDSNHSKAMHTDQEEKEENPAGQTVLTEPQTMLEQPGAVEGTRSVGGTKIRGRERNKLKEVEIQCLREERKGGICPLTVSDLVNDVMCDQRKGTQESKQLSF